MLQPALKKDLNTAKMTRAALVIVIGVMLGELFYVNFSGND